MGTARIKRAKEVKPGMLGLCLPPSGTTPDGESMCLDSVICSIDSDHGGLASLLYLNLRYTSIRCVGKPSYLSLLQSLHNISSQIVAKMAHSISLFSCYLTELQDKAIM